MANSESHQAEYSVVAQAPAEVAFDLLADVTRWPQLLTPIVHAEFVRQSGTQDTIAVWELSGKDAVRTWQARRTLDRDGLRIAYTEQPALLDVAAVRGEWSLLPQPDGSTRITVAVEYTGGGADLEKHTVARLDELKRAAERAPELADLTIDFEDPVFAGGAVEDAWQVLYEADKWPEKLAHVLRLEMTEDTPNIQFFDMDTEGRDGSTVTTRSVRVCLPQRLIVYKQISPPPLLEVHTGHWRFTPTPEGVILGARHTCTIRPDRTEVLGAGTTVAGARRYLRKFLSANSTTNLRLAKAVAEERSWTS